MRSIHPTRTSQKQCRRLSRTASFSVKVRVRRARAIIEARLAAVNGRGSARTKMKYMVRFCRW
jgi:phage gp37-like protein